MTPPPDLRRRLEGWEARLVDVVEAARSRSYQLGQHDCFSFACGAVQALTGVELWAAWRGRYSTKLGALRCILDYDAGGFTDAFSKLFGIAPVRIGLAHRGDIAEIVDAKGEQHLGVVLGATVAGLGESGLYFVNRSSCAHAWRIG